MLHASSSITRSAALTSTSGTPARHQQTLLKMMTIMIETDINIHIATDPSNQPVASHLYPPCPDRSRYRLCVSLPSNISKVYLPLSFSVGLQISIQTFCMLLPGFVLASWSILFSLHGKEHRWTFWDCYTCFRSSWLKQKTKNMHVMDLLLSLPSAPNG